MTMADIKMRGERHCEVEARGQQQKQEFASPLLAPQVSGSEGKGEQPKEAEGVLDETGGGKVEPLAGGIEFAEEKGGAAFGGDFSDVGEPVEVGLGQQAVVFGEPDRASLERTMQGLEERGGGRRDGSVA